MKSLIHKPLSLITKTKIRGLYAFTRAPSKPPELKTACEKLVTAAYLLQAMPEPSMTSGRNLRREAQALIEQAAMQQAESSASRMRSIAPK